MKKEYDVNYKQHLKKAVYMKEIIILTDKGGGKLFILLSLQYK